jgi:hypothetical protein
MLVEPAGVHDCAEIDSVWDADGAFVVIETVVFLKVPLTE